MYSQVRREDLGILQIDVLARKVQRLTFDNMYISSIPTKEEMSIALAHN